MNIPSDEYEAMLLPPRVIHRPAATQELRAIVQELLSDEIRPKVSIKDRPRWLRSLWEGALQSAHAGADLSTELRNQTNKNHASMGAYLLNGMHAVLSDAEVAEWVELGVERNYPYWWDDLSPSMTAAQMLQALERGCDPTPRQAHNNGLQRCLRLSRQPEALQVWDRLWQHPQAKVWAQATEQPSNDTLWHLLTADEWKSASRHELETVGLAWLRRLDATEISVHTANNYGETPLHVNGFTQELLRRGASVHAKNSTGQGPLVYAACGGSAASVHALLQAGAAIDAVDEVGRTALWQATATGKWSRIERLLKAGADPHISDHQGESPFTLMEGSPSLYARWGQWQAKGVARTLEAALPDASPSSVRPRRRM